MSGQEKVKVSDCNTVSLLHFLAKASPNCPKCGAPPSRQKVRNYDPDFLDGDVYCTVCGSFVRHYDAG